MECPPQLHRQAELTDAHARLAQGRGERQPVRASPHNRHLGGIAHLHCCAQAPALRPGRERASRPPFVSGLWYPDMKESAAIATPLSVAPWAERGGKQDSAR